MSALLEGLSQNSANDDTVLKHCPMNNQTFNITIWLYQWWSYANWAVLVINAVLGFSWCILACCMPSPQLRLKSSCCSASLALNVFKKWSASRIRLDSFGGFKNNSFHHHAEHLI